LSVPVNMLADSPYPKKMMDDGSRVRVGDPHATSPPDATDRLHSLGEKLESVAETVLLHPGVTRRIIVDR